MRRRFRNQLVLDLDRGGRGLPRAVAPDGLLQALADLLLDALDQQNKAIPAEPEQTEATNFWKPGRSTKPDPERPRSSSIT